MDAFLWFIALTIVKETTRWRTPSICRQSTQERLRGNYSRLGPLRHIPTTSPTPRGSTGISPPLATRAGAVPEDVTDA